MNEEFVKSLYKSIIEENIELYKDLFETTNPTGITDEYFEEVLGLYQSLNKDHKEIFFKIIEQTMIDTVSNTLGIIDGSSTLIDSTLEPKLLLDSKNTEGELQDCFLEFIEKNELNK
ncbi:transposase [Filobacillus milosensis]|uniref:Transposase n=1 Tax=Filobacillus milosensis TaxID=94137 RepID=A0A4Y8IQX6_9BACI|nr:transposase [Filobacillus milosensis]TFB24082.1 transposase [Filobacillus milosensis]